jgi:hypothetical protein
MRSIKNIIAVFAAAVLLASCEKKSYVAAFDELPQERVAKQIDSVRTILTGAANGWIGILSTGTGGGFGFYMEFDNQENVKMVADLTNTSATEMKTSRYRVRQDVGAALTFDTYNYISMLNSPDPTIFGGTIRDGFRSDIDFIYDHAATDSIIFIGKRYRQILKLVKATAEQKLKYTSGEYRAAVQGFKNYFSTKFNSYIQIGDDKVAISASTDSSLGAGKRIVFTRTVGSTAVNQTAKFGFTIDKMVLTDPGTTIQDNTIMYSAWKDANTLSFYDKGGKEFEVRQSATPLISFLNLFDYNKSYKEIYIAGNAYPAGVSSPFNAIWQATVARFAAMSPTREIVYLKFQLFNSTDAIVALQSRNATSTFAAATATYKYNYNRETGVITLSNPVYDGNWTARTTQLVDVQNFFLSGPFKVDWVPNPNPALGNLGGLYRVADPASFFYGRPQ